MGEREGGVSEKGMERGTYRGGGRKVERDEKWEEGRMGERKKRKIVLIALY